MLIVGGGKIGKSLATLLLERKYEVSIIEKNRIKCEKLANELDATVIKGDGTNVNVLDSAGAKDCECLMAVTGSDQDNLVVSQLGNKYFNAKKIIARVNNPLNTATFKVLGITNTVSSTEVISRMIEQEVDLANMHLLATLNKGEAGISSMHVNAASKAIGKTLTEIEFPKNTLVVSIIRNEEVIIPNGATIIQPDDEVIALTDEKNQKAMAKLICGAQ